MALDRLPDDWREGYPNGRFEKRLGGNESVDLTPYLAWLDWVITGCERAAKSRRRQMPLKWVREINLQCLAAGVPHFFKQAYVDERGVPCESPLLDGIVVQEFPRSRVELWSLPEDDAR